MCGIVCALDLKQSSNVLRSQVLEMSKKVRHRGPDWNGIHCGDNVLLAHERLAIVDPASGNQPIYSEDKSLILAANGEIYNHRELRNMLNSKYSFQTNSDCEIILALYSEKGPDFIDDLNGIFGFVLYDENNDEYLIARDHMGIIPLYMGWDKHGTFYVSSELKALEGICNKIEIFPPGHLLHSKNGKLKKWYVRDWMKFDNVKDNQTDLNDLQNALEKAVHRQLMSDVPYGVLLSGGLDSSITSALAKKYSKNRVESNDLKAAWYPQLHSFAVGLKGSPDLEAAKKVAEHIDSIHHEITFTVQEGLDAIKDVIYHLETYDVTTVRASTPMYLMARVIKSMGIKMVLSGEGADEIFGGYLYFLNAPNDKQHSEECIKRVNALPLFDNLRANKSTMAWGVEARVPFLDKRVVELGLNMPAILKRNCNIEKWILRKAFDVKYPDGSCKFLPDELLWRQKEQFSDGVGYSWIDRLKEVAEEQVSDYMLSLSEFRYPHNTPKNKEENIEYLFKKYFYCG